MSLAADTGTIVGINWGSSNCRAYLIGRDGTLVDEYQRGAGVAGLDRDGMSAVAEEIGVRWPGARPTYAAGMIGSNVGWVEVPYAQAPAGSTDIAAATTHTEIGTLSVTIVPGITCRRAVDGPSRTF